MLKSLYPNTMHFQIFIISVLTFGVRNSVPVRIASCVPPDCKGVSQNATEFAFKNCQFDYTTKPHLAVGTGAGFGSVGVVALDVNPL